MKQTLLVYLLLRLSIETVHGKYTFFDEVIKHLDKKFFIFHNESYQNWGQWSECSNDCKKYRERVCRTKFVEKGDILTCPSKLIREIAFCNYGTKCKRKGQLILKNETLSSLPKNCGWKPESLEVKRKIFGGLAAKEGSWPWNLALVFLGTDSVTQPCSATLISPQWAITAAHCLFTNVLYRKPLGILVKLESKSVAVIVNDFHKNIFDGNEIRIFVTHAVTHPDFRHGLTYTDYDFALLRLEASSIQMPSHNFACIHQDEDFNLPRESDCYALGWGLQNAERSAVPSKYDDRLQEVKLPLISYERCKSIYGDIYINYTIHVCAGMYRKDTCVGDSGAGLFCQHPDTKRWILYGVVSFGLDEDCGESIGVFARISGALTWIRDTIKTMDFP